jgi:hypothetical protein
MAMASDLIWLWFHGLVAVLFRRGYMCVILTGLVYVSGTSVWWLLAGEECTVWLFSLVAIHLQKSDNSPKKNDLYDSKNVPAAAEPRCKRAVSEKAAACQVL